MTAPKKAAATKVGTKKPDRSGRTKPTGDAVEAPKMPENRTVEFEGRNIEVKAPSPETLVLWGRDIQAFQKNKTVQDLEVYGNLLDRLWEALLGVVANEEDRQWLREGVKKNEISMMTAHAIMSGAMEAYENRAARRAK
jgi:hypothetical protein